ncbi:ribonuclease T2 family protein [Falsirhodobacter deserti]|uniref:ribonuclease T2 family protein n=1 Tax=Falsirhodobacter deserti TaxID=1365611 RepID=UPI000FE3B1FE|nr:ribonuclease T2 [Falsirhodobacter deserti]
MRLALLLILLALPARAQAFDYYILALSWSPTWCQTDGGPHEPQCRQDFGFIVHGLWPQYEEGWPEWCETDARGPSHADRAAMADITDPDLALHEWRKHGTCTGLSASGYYAQTRKAWNSVTLPPALQSLRHDRRLPASEVEEAFLSANPQMVADGVTVTCDAGRIDEVRICMTRDLAPRTCAPDARRDCTRTAVMPGR